MKYSLTVYIYRKENEILFHTSERKGKNEIFLDRIFLPEGNERSFLNTSEREGKKKKIKESLTVCCAGRSERGSQSDSVRKTVFCNKLSFFATPYNAVFVQNVCTEMRLRDGTGRTL